MTLQLRPDHLAILQAIGSSGPIIVTDLVKQIDLDRGTIEAGIGSLAKDGHISRETETRTTYSLTTRGEQVVEDGLAERKIIEAIQKEPIHMKDLADVADLSKGDMTAGIGILRKAGIIEISKGKVKLVDDDQASDFSMDLVQALQSIQMGNTVDTDVIDQLTERNFIEEKEETIVTVDTKLSKSEISSIKAVEEVTKLTPKMISDGSWKNVSFKPYSLKTKPRIIHAGRFQPYRQFLEHLRRKLIGLGFVEMKGPIVEQEFWNFDALYAPQDHSAREDNDILLIEEPSHGELLDEDYVKNVAATHEDGWKTGSKGHDYKWDPRKAARLLLRPQGTAISARTLAKLEPPAKHFSIARCYRPDQIDATHAIEFNQTEGIICDPNITFRDLLGMLKTFAIEVAGADEVRFRPDYYPFTAPSVELSAKHPVLGYIEFGGAGIFRPEVTQPFGIDYPVLAWGLGVGRLFMTKYEISDIRELFSQNLDWLRTEKVSAGMEVDI